MPGGAGPGGIEGMTITTETAAAVRLAELRKVYGAGDRAVTALAGLTLDFARGTFTAIMGPSGSGKSTLLLCAAGLEEPTAGRVTIGDADLGPLNEHRRTLLRRERIGFVFQAFNLVASLTAAQNVELPLRLAGRRPKPERVLAALAEVGLADRAGHLPTELSGGQQQRVAIARALITRPDVLFADEPTGALDTTTSREVLGLVREVVDRHGQTVIMVTHDPVAAAYADRVVFLKDGRIADEMRAPGAEGPAQVAARMTRLEAM
ncbi:MAG: ABC transporter ATP-binding protein [Hamadaea sp.]|nr:ABC transporter ATP-binding protein [Hamadaea sp.]